MTEEQKFHLAAKACGKDLTGWRFIRNSDGSIGIFGPPPRPDESQRTSDAIYQSTNRDLHELLGRLADYQASLIKREEKSIRALAWITPKGRVHADTRFENETDAWFIALGWPGDEEVERAKKEGHRIEWVTIVFD